MRWKRTSKIAYNRVTRTFFAWTPFSVNGEVIWLERVTVKGYWWQGFYTRNWYWENEELINNLKN